MPTAPGSLKGGTARASSPPVVGSSTLTPSAPRSERNMRPYGPAPSCVKARMRTPSSGSGPLTPTRRCSYIRLSRSNDGDRMSTTGAFKDVIKRGREPERTLPVGEFIAQLDQFIAEHNPYRQSKVIPAIGGGQASLEVVKRYAKELYYLGLWMTPEFPLLIANAPDTDAFTLEDSEHYAHWTQNFADECGYLRDPNHVLMKVVYTRALGIPDEELRAYVPMPETIGSVYTMLYYVRRSYEEGLAAFGYPRERVAGMSGYAKTLYEGLYRHYGVRVKDLEVHAYAEQEHGDKALELMQRVCTSAHVQRRVRQAVEHTILTNEWRTGALNRWLDEPGALDGPARRRSPSG